MSQEYPPPRTALEFHQSLQKLLDSYLAQRANLYENRPGGMDAFYSLFASEREAVVDFIWYLLMQYGVEVPKDCV